MNPLFIATQTPFADRLFKMMWQAYGPLIKAVAIVALVVLVIFPIIGFVKRVFR
ncbi:hypothetical protein [Oleiharenicola lentus]|uniref:hypothetical protein n=1 Tax=Oleiharenicola lentus TaxID=2508720 RepID=UPI003F67F420